MSKSVRYHFTAPENDTQIANWVKQQHNFSTSMRMLIKDYIAKYGMTDVSCLPIQINKTVVPEQATEETKIVENQSVHDKTDNIEKDVDSIVNDSNDNADDENTNVNNDDDDAADDMLASLMR